METIKENEVEELINELAFIAKKNFKRDLECMANKNNIDDLKNYTELYYDTIKSIDSIEELLLELKH